MELGGRVAVVTGASRGIGRAIAKKLAEHGADILINYIKEEAQALSLQSEIQALGRRAEIFKADVSKEEDVIKMSQFCTDRLGSADILVNNAGIVWDIDWKERTVEQWERTLKVNLIGQFLTAKHFSDQLEKSKYGRIINISSTNAFNSFSQFAMDYDASKAGIITLTRSLAEALAPNVLVNAVAPGWVETEMNAELPADFIKEEAEKIYLKRFAKPEEIAELVAFLASDRASYINGEVIKIDGGSR